jgi:hypothetical protein
MHPIVLILIELCFNVGIVVGKQKKAITLSRFAYFSFVLTYTPIEVR